MNKLPSGLLQLLHMRIMKMLVDAIFLVAAECGLEHGMHRFLQFYSGLQGFLELIIHLNVRNVTVWQSTKVLSRAAVPHFDILSHFVFCCYF